MPERALPAAGGASRRMRTSPRRGPRRYGPGLIGVTAGLALLAGVALGAASLRPPSGPGSARSPGAAPPAFTSGQPAPRVASNPPAGQPRPGAAVPAGAGTARAAALIAARAPAIRVALLPPEVPPGEAVAVVVQPGTRLIAGEFQAFDRTIVLRPTGGRWAGLLGVDYRVQPGTYPVTVRLAVAGGKPREQTLALVVTPRAFPESRLRVKDPQSSVLDEGKWAADRARIAAARQTLHPGPLWGGPFLRPVEGPVTTEFGLVRYVNDEEYGRHSGVDIAAPRGTPVRAAAAGRVILAEALYITGNTVILDHGMGLTTSYSHLDRIAVAAGTEVQAGDVVGTVGDTGFATGPHLHWGVAVHGVFVNPWPFLEASPLDRD